VLVSPPSQPGRLTPSQFGVLESLHHWAECQGSWPKDSQEQRQHHDGGGQSGKCHLVERRRQGEDRRFVTVHLTSKAWTSFEISCQAVERIVQELSQLTAEEQELLAPCVADSAYCCPRQIKTERKMVREVQPSRPAPERSDIDRRPGGSLDLALPDGPRSSTVDDYAGSRWLTLSTLEDLTV